MADEVDQANQLADLELSIALRNAQIASSDTGSKLKPKGICHYCESEVGPNQLFCDSACAADYDREEKLKKRR